MNPVAFPFRHDIAGKDSTTPPQDHTELGYSFVAFFEHFFLFARPSPCTFFLCWHFFFFFAFFLARNFFLRFQQESFLLEQNH